MNEDFIKRNLLIIIIIGILVIGITLYKWEYEDERIDKMILNVEFSGRVQKMVYDIKEFPTITIRDSDYYIGSGYNTDHQIEPGDSVVKKRGSFTYKLIKHVGGKEVEFSW